MVAQSPWARGSCHKGSTGGIPVQSRQFQKGKTIGVASPDEKPSYYWWQWYSKPWPPGLSLLHSHSGVPVVGPSNVSWPGLLSDCTGDYNLTVPGLDGSRSNLKHPWLLSHRVSLSVVMFGCMSIYTHVIWYLHLCNQRYFIVCYLQTQGQNIDSIRPVSPHPVPRSPAAQNKASLSHWPQANYCRFGIMHPDLLICHLDAPPYIPDLQGCIR